MQQVGFDVWRDVEDMRGGQDWKEQLRHAIGSVDVVIVLLTPASVASKYVLWECDTAQTLGKRVIGVLIKPCQVPNELLHLHYHNLSNPGKYTAGFASLIRDLNELKGMPMSDQKQDNSSASKFDFRGSHIQDSIVGDHGVIYNGVPQNTAAFMQQITQVLRAEHQQLRITIVTELKAASADQRHEIEMILQHYRRGQISSQEVANFITTMKDLITHVRNGSLSMNNELVKISEQLEQVYSSALSQQHQFELTLPIIPGILCLQVYGRRLSGRRSKQFG